MSKNILIFAAEGFEELELTAPRDIWKRAGFEVTIASISSTKTVKSQAGFEIIADKLLSDVQNELFDLIFLPGGSAYAVIQESSMVEEVIKKHLAENKLVTAICAAPIVLDKFISNKNMTCYPTMSDMLHNNTYSKESVVIDLPIVTGRGPGSSIEFGLTIVEVLADKKLKDEVASHMVF